MGVSVEGSEAVWPDEKSQAFLPQFDVFNRQSHYIDIFNRGKGSLDFSIKTDNNWIILKRTNGTFGFDYRINVTIDWDKVQAGQNNGIVRISGLGIEVPVMINAFKPSGLTRQSLTGFVEGNGYVSIEAEHITKLSSVGDPRWSRIENYGHTLSAMRSTGPADAAQAIPDKNSSCIEYKIYFFNTGTFKVTGVFAPTLNYMAGRGLQYGISFDDEIPQVINLVPNDYNARNGNSDWENTVSDNARFSKSTHNINSSGYHTLKIFMIDPGVVLQKIIVNTGGLKPSYLGPPESYHNQIEAP
jgi:hypothetical protein